MQKSIARNCVLSFFIDTIVEATIQHLNDIGALNKNATIADVEITLARALREYRSLRPSDFIVEDIPEMQWLLSATPTIKRKIAGLYEGKK